MSNHKIEALRGLVSKNAEAYELVRFLKGKGRCRPNTDVTRLVRDFKKVDPKFNKERALGLLAKMQEIGLGTIEFDKNRVPRFTWNCNFIDVCKLAIPADTEVKSKPVEAREHMAEPGNVRLTIKGVTVEVDNTPEAIRSVFNALSAS